MRRVVRLGFLGLESERGCVRLVFERWFNEMKKKAFRDLLRKRKSLMRFESKDRKGFEIEFVEI